MKTITRTDIQRMGGGKTTGIGGNGGGSFDPSALTGYATEQWTKDNFVAIEWFDQIFQVFDDTTKIAVNADLPADQSKLNIKAMFGFWTNFYVSALGNGGQVGASITLASLADVNVAGVTNGQVLTWNSAQSKWIATTPQSGGADMNAVWNALAANTNEQINASHLSTALTGYATTTDLSGYLPLTGGTLTGALGVSGRLSGGGDDEGIVITPASNGYAGLILGGTSGRRSVFYLNNSSAFWRYCSGDGASYYDITHPNASGTIALQSWVSQQGFATTAWVGQQLQSYIPKHNIESTSGSIPSWGTLTSSNGYSAGAIWSFPGGSDLAFAYKNGQVSMQVDGMFYQREGNYECIDSGGGQTIGGTLGVTGTITCGNLYSNGYVTALSDQREKNIIEDFEIPLDYIANAPIVSYEWKDKERRGDKQHIGSIAQYWLREMPELVPEVNGRYTMDYGRIALLSAITVARTVVNHEQRLRELERRLINN